MKKELFDRIIVLVTELILKDKTLPQLPPKITENDNIISYCWLVRDDDGTLEQAKALFKEYGYKGLEVKTRLENSIRGCDPYKMYFTILYGKDTDKISISNFMVGYKWAHNKERYYPLNKNLPHICYSKHLYTFNRFNKPRHCKGNGGHYDNLMEPIMHLILGIDFKTSIAELAKYYKGAKSDWDVLENKYQCKIPKAIREFSIRDVNALYSVLENKGEINRICQFLSNLKERDEYNEDDLWVVINDMTIKGNNTWLVRDWIIDAASLKKKISLKISSVKRMEDEHRKMSKERMIAGIKSIKVHDCYKDLFKDSDLDIELITNKTRLLRESIEQDHCVATYANSINSGSCAIFSIMHNGRRYTAQISNDHANSFNVVQVKGFRNNRDSEELSKGSQEVTDILEKKLGIFRSLCGTIMARVVEPIQLPF